MPPRRENIAVRDTYQLLLPDEATMYEHLSYRLYSPFLDIKEADIAMGAELRSESYLADIIKSFQKEGQINLTATYFRGVLDAEQSKRKRFKAIQGNQ